MAKNNSRKNQSKDSDFVLSPEHQDYKNNPITNIDTHFHGN